jgi:hypothetical protein
MAIMWNNETDRDHDYELEPSVSYLCRTGRCSRCGDPNCNCEHHDEENDVDRTNP